MRYVRRPNVTVNVLMIETLRCREKSVNMTSLMIKCARTTGTDDQKRRKGKGTKGGKV